MLKQALLVIDMQNDFCLADAVLCVQGAMSAHRRVIQAVDLARRKGIPVIWVIREHEASGIDVERFREPMFKEGRSSTVKGTPGAQLVAGLEVQPGEQVLVKTRFSAFFDTNLDRILRRMGVEDVVIAGVQTPNCIRGTAWDAIALDYPRVTVLADATASASDQVQQANLYDMRQVCVATPTVAEWAAQLGAEAA